MTFNTETLCVSYQKECILQLQNGCENKNVRILKNQN
jgi:hypothetical protein